MEHLPSGIPQRLLGNMQPDSVDKSIVWGYMTYPRIVYQDVRCFAKSKTLKCKPDATLCQTMAIAIIWIRNLRVNGLNELLTSKDGWSEAMAAKWLFLKVFTIVINRNPHSLKLPNIPKKPFHILALLDSSTAGYRDVRSRWIPKFFLQRMLTMPRGVPATLSCLLHWPRDISEWTQRGWVGYPPVGTAHSGA